MTRTLPANSHLAHLKHQAKDLLKEFRAGLPDAVTRFRQFYPRPADPAAVSLSSAQFVIAREYGFASWTRLKHHVEGLEALERRVERLRSEFASGNAASRRRLLQPAHDTRRFQNFDPDASSISDADARLLIANQEGYAFWAKYESYLHLDPAVRLVIQAVRTGDLKALRKLLRSDPWAANPRWTPGYRPPDPLPNDSVPLFCASEGVFRGTNPHNNDYELVRALLDAGAEIEIAGGLPLTSALSFHATGAVEALLDGGASPDGPDGDGVPMAYPLHFADPDLAELLARRGAKLDLRFAAGIGDLDRVRSFFLADGSLKRGAGALADPYGLELKYRGHSPFRYERTRENILSQALYFACNNNRIETAAFLLAQGADVNAIVPGLDFQPTILHRLASLHAGRHSSWAVIENLRPLIQFLLDHGASLSIRDREHQTTPIAWAYYCGREDILDMLIAYAGIHDAVRCGRIARVRELLERDPALASSRDEQGRTPRDLLRPETPHGKEIADLLRSHGA